MGPGRDESGGYGEGERGVGKVKYAVNGDSNTNPRVPSMIRMKLFQIPALMILNFSLGIFSLSL